MPSSPFAGTSSSVRRLGVVGLVLCSLLGCTLFSKPLCDEENGVMDPRLLGTWEIPVSGVDGDRCTWMSAAITKAEGKNSLTIGQSYDCSGDRSEVTLEARTLELGGRWFLSARDPNSKASPDWFTFQYRFVSPDEIHVFWLDESRLMADVRSGRLPGRVGVPDSGLLLKWLGVKPEETLFELKATPEQMRDYLQEHPDTGFDLDEPLYVLKRSTGEPKPVRTKPPAAARAIDSPAVEPPTAAKAPEPDRAEPPKPSVPRFRKRLRNRPRTEERARPPLEKNEVGPPVAPPRP